jgi:hypothetical protein
VSFVLTPSLGVCGSRRPEAVARVAGRRLATAVAIHALDLVPRRVLASQEGDTFARATRHEGRHELSELGDRIALLCVDLFDRGEHVVHAVRAIDPDDFDHLFLPFSGIVPADLKRCGSGSPEGFGTDGACSGRGRDESRIDPPHAPYGMFPVFGLHSHSLLYRSAGSNPLFREFNKITAFFNAGEQRKTRLY